MTASLIVAGIELLDNAAAPQWQLSGAYFNQGDPAPDQATIESTYLDGEAVTGRRARNRSIDIPLWVFGINALDLAANRDKIWQAVNQDTFTIQWTPSGGLPVVFDCFRATVTRPKNVYLANNGTSAMRIQCDAKPFGRSTVAETITVAGSEVQIDSFDTAPTGATLDTTTKIEGTGSALYHALHAGAPAGTVSRSFTAKDISAQSTVTVWNYIGRSGSYTTTATLTLASSGGSTSYSGSITGLGDNWNLIGFSLASGTVASGTGVNLAAVTSYTLTLTNNLGGLDANCYADDLRARGSASAQVSTTHASQLLLPVSKGSARAPANLTVTNGSTLSAFLLHSPPADQAATALILSSLSSGSNDQTVTIPAGNAGFRGTYTVVVSVPTIAGGGASQNAVITITQKENGTAVGTTGGLNVTYASGAPLVALGQVTLPLYDTPGDNTTTSYTIRVQTLTGADRYSELMLLDTRGQTIYTDTALAAAAAAVYVDEPAATQSGPSVYASASDRTAAYGVLGNCVVTGGPILLEPGTNKFIAWVGTATPALTATYYPRWLDERSS